VLTLIELFITAWVWNESFQCTVVFYIAFIFRWLFNFFLQEGVLYGMDNNGLWIESWFSLNQTFSLTNNSYRVGTVVNCCDF
jgi:hypothetical protein